MDMSDFGDRVRKARKHAKLSQEQLAGDIGIKQGSLSELERVGNSSTFTVQIAQRCGVRADWLATGDGLMLSTSLPQMGDADTTASNVLLVGLNKSIPRLAWDEIQGFIQGMFKPPHDRYEVVSARNVTERCFLLEVAGDAMQGQGGNVPSGSILVCDPDKQADSGAYVIAIHPKSGEPVFRRLVIDGGVWFLKANDPAYPLVEVAGPEAIIARVVRIKMEMDV